jgi:DNA polymerase-1
LSLQQSLKWTIDPAASRGQALDALPESLESPRVSLDVETDGIDVYGNSMPIGISVADANQEFYLPFGHYEGRQHPAAKVRGWLEENLAGKEIIFRNAKFDIEMCRKWGLDLESIGCCPREIQHATALLDDRRRTFSLESLAQDRLGIGKVDLPPGRIVELPAHVVGNYARRDARLTYDLDISYETAIKAEELEKVLQLENNLIYATLSMEREGAWLDVPKLERWIIEVEEARVARILEIHRRTGVRVNPNSPDTMKRLFNYLKVDIPISFDEDHLKDESAPEIQLALEARQLASLLSKYLVKYRDAMGPGGRLRYQLHQLRADDGGTITGRYASSKVNIQQVMKPDKQEIREWIIRELFIPPKGMLFLDADASQIEFRLMCHYANAERLCKAYKEDPDTDFHQLVTDVVLKNCMSRTLAKNVNFMKVYGGGAKKLALMTGKSFEEAEEMDNTYNRMFPEAKRLLNRATRAAETRGYVKTFIGRRRRYYPGDRFYSALNSVLQGTAADVLKYALLALYNERKTLGFNLRATVHDEVIGDVPDEKAAARVRELLNEQRLPFRVPLTWQVATGKNWSDAK